MTASETAKSCPICERPATTAAAPFCSRRCADVDLHRWFSGRYAIPAAAPPLAAEDDDED